LIAIYALFFVTCQNAERLPRRRIGIPLIRASNCDKHFLTVNQLPAPFVSFGTASGSRFGEEPVFAGSTGIILGTSGLRHPAAR
jgi:hypothetical protein